MSSPTARGARGVRPGPPAIWIRAVLLAALLLGLLGTGSPSAGAEDLRDARDKVRKALVQAKQEVSADQRAVDKADDKLEASQAALAKARSELAYVRKLLAAARARDAAVAAELDAAEDAFDRAAAAVLRAQEKVDAQRALVGLVVRSAYQQHTDLQKLSLVLSAESAPDLAQRLQWSTTLFDSSTTQLDRLRELQAGLESARGACAEAEAKLSDQRKASAAHVAQVKRLSADASAHKARLDRLVAANRTLKAKAQDELESSRSQYRALERQEARIAARLRGDGYDVVNRGGFIRPVDAPNGSPFGMRYHPILRYWRMHWGTDFGAACGAPIRAMADGKVVSAGWTTYGFGNYTIISYGRMFGARLASGYAHQSRLLVRAGQRVKQGQVVGYVGNTGLSTGCHLHLQVYRNGARVNPMRYL